MTPTETATHTPGPWRAGIPGNFRIYAPDGLGEQSGPVAEAQHRFNREEQRANCALIAAAPDLLIQLKLLTEHMDRAGGDGYGMPECPWCKSQSDDNGHDADCELLKARGVIAKAEGR